MALVPPLNHWWHVTLHVSARGLTTAPMPVGDRHAEIELDVLEHRLRLRTSDGGDAGFALIGDSACAAFYRDLFRVLGELGVDVAIHPEPFDLRREPAVPRGHPPRRLRSRRGGPLLAGPRRDGARPRPLRRLLRRQGQPHPPVLALLRPRLRPLLRASATLPEGTDPITAEAYSHEVIAFGFWPGDERRTPFPAFYSYTAPEPAGLADRPLAGDEAAWQDTGSGSLATLPYDAVRAAPDPDAALLAFFESAYAAGTGAAGWDVAAFAH